MRNGVFSKVKARKNAWIMACGIAAVTE